MLRPLLPLCAAREEYLPSCFFARRGFVFLTLSSFNHAVIVFRESEHWELRALGMSKHQMKSIFRINSLFDGFISFIISIMFLVILNISGATQIFLSYLFPPDVYFIFHPIYDYGKIFLIFIVNLFCLLIASYYPSMVIGRNNIIYLIKTSNK